MVNIYTNFEVFAILKYVVIKNYWPRC